MKERTMRKLATGFSGAILSRADRRKARLGHTILGETNLVSTSRLETCKHSGPSTISIDAFVKSGAAISESFLRNCGVPEPFIIYARSFAGQPIQFHSCFISYSTKDQEFADRLYADLQQNAVRCWFAPRDIVGGKKVHEQIDEAIQVHDKELREDRRMLFPVRLVEFETLRDWESFDADTGNDSAREIREYFIPDFSHWKDHDAYKEAFERLLRDLKLASAASS